jgi:hypothetical protein
VNRTPPHVGAQPRKALSLTKQASDQPRGLSDACPLSPESNRKNRLLAGFDALLPAGEQPGESDS